MTTAPASPPASTESVLAILKQPGVVLAVQIGMMIAAAAPVFLLGF